MCGRGCAGGIGVECVKLARCVGKLKYKRQGGAGHVGIVCIPHFGDG
jgi:hypothetical protein